MAFRPVRWDQPRSLHARQNDRRASRSQSSARAPSWEYSRFLTFTHDVKVFPG